MALHIISRKAALCVAISLIAITLFISSIVRASCWNDAGKNYGIDPLLLKAIAWKESRGRTDAIGPKLKNGNHALGLMQINSAHLPKLAQFGILREHLFNPCVSQKVGAWLLAECIQRFGQTWKAVGCYYAGPTSKNIAAQVKYVLDVQLFYQGYQQQAQQQHVAMSAQTAGM